MRRRTSWLGWTCGVGLIALGSDAGATYSVVATDSDSGQVGGAGTSCVGTLDVSIIYGGAPGFGAIHAQAAANLDGRDEGVDLLAMSTAPADIIAAITDPGFDANASRRQYGVVDLEGRAAGHTGADNLSYAEDRQAVFGAFTYSVQGNILTSQLVLDNTASAFEGPGCDLADRLILAIEAGATGGEGDSRCTPRGVPSDSAFLHVDDADGTVLVHLSVTNTGNVSPLIQLRADYDAWRADNPCPGTGADAGPTAGPDAGDSGADDGDSGCGCRTGGDAPGAGALVLLLAAAAALRPRRRGCRPRCPGRARRRSGRPS